MYPTYAFNKCLYLYNLIVKEPRIIYILDSNWEKNEDDTKCYYNVSYAFF